MNKTTHLNRNPGHQLRAAVLAFFVFSSCFLFNSCEKMLETYVGLPMQPTNINSEYEPGLNVFGMLKAGSIMDTLNHFFEVQQILHVFDTTDIAIYDADISLQLDDQIYNLDPYSQGRYTHPALEPLPGQEWKYSCYYDTFEVRSVTIIPNTPELRTGSIEIDEGSLRLSIAYDSSAFMYDVYYIDESSFITKRLIPTYGKDSDAELEIQYDQTSAINLLFVIAYDRKYEQYVNTSNIFFKPNAFRPKFTTVEGGYGCFCSLNSLMIDLKNNEEEK